jgi:hypothetical protein
MKAQRRNKYEKVAVNHERKSLFVGEILMNLHNTKMQNLILVVRVYWK